LKDTPIPPELPSNHDTTAAHVIEITFLSTCGNPHNGMSRHHQDEGHHDVGLTRARQGQPLTDPHDAHPFGSALSPLATWFGRRRGVWDRRF
jgi:hypothetical protein